MSRPEEPAGDAERRVVTAELLAVGSELLVGETQDTNSRELATRLTQDGVRVVRIQAVPDEQAAVRDAFVAALERADLVVSTGGLGPTPDDLTREAIAEVAGERPQPDPAIEAWLRDLFRRRGAPFPERNLKQAWLIPSATALPNAYGTAPGWWVDRPNGRIIVALPGPPREMRPMWVDEVRPRLLARGLGRAAAVRTLRLTGIGESQVAELIGDELLASRNPAVATYARAEGVDVRISATAENGGPDDHRTVTEDDRTVTEGDRTVTQSAARAAEAAVRAVEARLLPVLGSYVWAYGATSWVEAIDAALRERGWTLASSERGTAGALAGLLGAAPSLALAEVRAGEQDGIDRTPADEATLERTARELVERAGAAVGIVLETQPRGGDTAVHVAVVTPHGIRVARRLAFLAGADGRTRAAIAAAAVLLESVRGVSAEPSGGGPRDR